MKHLALCGPGEASEKTGQISITIRSAIGRTDARYSARISLAEGECSGAGTLSQDAHSFLDCGAQGRIPLRLWLKPREP